MQITQLSVTVTLLYFIQNILDILIEIKEENSSNIFLITVNENLYFKIWSPFQPLSHKAILYWCLKVTIYWCLGLKQSSSALRGTHTLFLKFEFYIIKTDSQKFILDCNFLGFTNTKISNIYSPKITSPFFWEKITPLFFWKIEPQLSSLLKSGGDPVMINQNHLILLSLGNREDTRGEGIILGENPVGHCSV